MAAALTELLSAVVGAIATLVIIALVQSTSPSSTAASAGVSAPGNGAGGTCSLPPLVRADCKLTKFGGHWQGTHWYGAWTLCSEPLGPHSVVFSVGIGGDVSFDTAIVKSHGVRLSAFDPTITSARFDEIVAPHQLSAAQRGRIKFYPFGLAAEDDVLAFYHHNNSKYASLVTTPGVPGFRKEVWLRAPVLRVQSMQFIVGVPQIDVLKMDIEGAEWSMFRRRNTGLREWLRCNPPQQIAIEFHDRFFKKAKWVSRKSVQRLLDRCGFTLRHENPQTKEEVLFVRDRPATAEC